MTTTPPHPLHRTPPNLQLTPPPPCTALPPNLQLTPPPPALHSPPTSPLDHFPLPTFFFQSAILPMLIVGDSAGIESTWRGRQAHRRSASVVGRVAARLGGDRGLGAGGGRPRQGTTTQPRGHRRQHCQPPYCRVWVALGYCYCYHHCHFYCWRQCSCTAPHTWLTVVLYCIATAD